MVAALGDDDQVLAAAAKLVAAEQNFNPFAVSVPKICSDPSLPATEALRGIVPLVDPAVDGAAAQNARSAASLASPLNAAGQSVADLMAANGFSNFVPQDSTGRTGAVAGSSGSSGSGNAGNVNDAEESKAEDKAQDKAKGSKAGDSKAVDSETEDNKAPKNPSNSNTGAAGADFGRCTPTMDFKAGRAGRKADEFTFLPTDALVAQGQQDALNPNIITTRICDQLTNVCDANDAAKAACQAAKAKVQALGTRDASTAAAFNSALGF